MPRADVNEGQHEDGRHHLQHHRPSARGRFQQLLEAQALILVLLNPKERASYAFACFLHSADFSMPCGLSRSPWLLLLRNPKKRGSIVIFATTLQPCMRGGFQQLPQAQAFVSITTDATSVLTFMLWGKRSGMMKPLTSLFNLLYIVRAPRHQRM